MSVALGVSVSVVVCTYSRARWDNLRAAIESLRRQTLAPLEIVVVVDHEPSLAEHLRLAEPDVVVVENDGPRGLSSARNRGIAASHGDVVAFLDDDAVADGDWLKRISRGYANPHVGAVGGSVDPEWEAGRPRWFPPEFDWVVGCSYPGLPTAPAPTRNLIGANMSFRRDVLERTGEFREGVGRVGATPLGCEETELCIRAARGNGNGSGAIVLYDPAARVRHRVPPARARRDYFFRRCYAEGISKAHVAALVGTRAGLRSERSYTSRILPAAVARGVRDAARGDPAGLGRALAIVGGLAATAGGFAVGAARRRPRAVAAAPHVALVAVALGLWVVALGRTDVRAMTDLGLLSVLPPAYFAAIAVLTGSFVVALRKPHLPQPVLALHAAAYIMVIHATPTLLYGTLRYAWAWKHVGIVDYIERHGSVDPSISFLDAYHNWPAFFAAAALLTKAAGLHLALGFAAWAPPFFNLLFLGALVVLLRALTSNYRRVWLAVWIFFSASWVGQDYFSPQAFGYFLFLVVVAICVGWFRPPFGSHGRRRGLVARFVRLGDDDAPPPAASTGAQRAGLVALVVATCVAVVASHQLTPFMLIGGLGALVLFRRCTLRSLPLLVAVLTVAWTAFLAVGFLRGNLYWIVQSIGNPAGNANSTLINLAHASSGQRLVAYVDRGLTVGVWGLAVLGFARRFWRGHVDLIPALLAAAPFLMLWGNAYGGEMLFRVYFFSLPFVAFLAAGLLFPASDAAASVSWPKAALAGALGLVLFGGLLFGYYGKERENYFSAGEVRATEYLYRVAPPGAILVGAAVEYPLPFEHYERYQYLTLASGDARAVRRAVRDPVGTIERLSSGQHPRPTYVLITRSQRAVADETGILPRGSLRAIQRKLAHSAAFRVIFENRDAVLFVHRPGGSA